MRYVLLIALLIGFLPGAFADDPAIERATLAQIEPGKTGYSQVVALLGPPNAVSKSEDGAQLLVYAGNRAPLKHRVGFLFFNWTKESPGAAYRTVVTLRDNVVESVVSN